MTITESTVGVCQWFHFDDKRAVEHAVRRMRELGLTHLRTGVSWADYYRPGGEAWYNWQMKALAEFEVLLSVWHTPPSISENRMCSGPPTRLQDYADFIDLLINDYGDAFECLELWNEPNNRLKWDFHNCDPHWRKFGAMICMAAHWAKQCGKTTVLGGMIPVDPSWFMLMKSYGAIEDVDIVGIHGFPGMWWPNRPNWDWCDHWHGWEHKVRSIAAVADNRPIWITETGLATFDLTTRQRAKHQLQVEKLHEAIAAPVDRIYWYSLIDLDPAREAIEGFHVDENEYHMGLLTADDHEKPAYAAMKRISDRQW